MKSFAWIFATTLLTACGGDDVLTSATFSSDIVQFNDCRSIAGRPEQCVNIESTATRRVVLDERAPDSVWLYGVRRNGIDNRAILGARKDGGGWIFADENVTTNATTGCKVVRGLTIVLDVDPDADATKIGVDPCVSLVGREVEVTDESAGCDTTNDPPEAVVRTLRRRWQAVFAATCAAAPAQ
jgi:hypothetical protein